MRTVLSYLLSLIIIFRGFLMLTGYGWKVLLSLKRYKKNAIWNCGNERASGLDGFTFKFIELYCPIMQDDIMRVVKHFE